MSVFECTYSDYAMSPFSCYCFVVSFSRIPQSQQDAAKKAVMVPAWDPDAGENSSASVYFCGVSKSPKDASKKPIMV
jgi:hypothetical protein